MEMLIADRQHCVSHEARVAPTEFNLLWIKIKSSMKNAIAIPRGMLTAAIDSLSGCDDGIRGVRSDCDDPRPAVIMKGGEEISVARGEGDYSLELQL